MDKYTKFILTVIAVGIIGLNYNLVLKGNIISKVEAADPSLRTIEIELGEIASSLGSIASSAHKIQVRGFW